MWKALKIQLITIVAVFFFPVITTAQNLHTIHIGRGSKREKPVFLKDIALEVEYIFLENNDNCQIDGPGHKIALNNYNIIVIDKVLHRFGRDGKFINSISGQGMGPGQYREIAGFDFDPNGESFYIFDRLGKIMNFHLNGDLISEQKVSSGLFATLLNRNLVLNLNSARFVGLSNGFRVLINDLQGKPISQLLNVDEETMNAIENLSVQNTNCYIFRDSATVWEGLSDRIYRANQDFNVTPKFYLDLGKHRMPKVLPISPGSPGYRKLIDKYVMPVRIFEIEHFVFLETSDRGNRKQYIYNKNTGVCANLSKRSGIINDFDGGPDFWPIGVTRDGKMYMLFDIVMLKQYWSPGTEFALKYPERQREFIRMLENSSVNNNPVIMVVTPKGN